MLFRNSFECLNDKLSNGWNEAETETKIHLAMKINLVSSKCSYEKASDSFQDT